MISAPALVALSLVAAGAMNATAIVHHHRIVPVELKMLRGVVESVPQAASEPKIAILSLLQGAAIPGLIAHLRAAGETGPSERDYVELQRLGLAAPGPVTWQLMLTPQGRRRAGAIARDAAMAMGKHNPAVGIRDGMAFFRCPCGVKLELSLRTRGAYADCRSAYDRHVSALARTIEHLPNARASIADASEAMAQRIKRFTDLTAALRRARESGGHG